MGHLPIYFYEVARSSSRRADPATTDKTAAAMSRSRDERGTRIWGTTATQNCNSSPQCAVDGSHSPVTARGIHGNVVSGIISVTDFLQ
jgi:hypothetical protein